LQSSRRLESVEGVQNDVILEEDEEEEEGGDDLLEVAGEELISRTSTDILDTQVIEVRKRQ